MKRAIFFTPRFIRSAKRFRKGHKDAETALRETLQLLHEDAFQVKLRTHKLKGKLQAYWSCSGGYDLRILFKLVEENGTEVIQLYAVGTHDEVY